MTFTRRLGAVRTGGILVLWALGGCSSPDLNQLGPGDGASTEDGALRIDAPLTADSGQPVTDGGTPTDGGRNADSGVPVDTGTIPTDAGERGDVAETRDGGVATDVGTAPMDTGTETDSGVPPTDTGTMVDTGTPMDIGVHMDAGTDLGAPMDAGTDTGVTHPDTGTPVDTGTDTGTVVDTGTDTGITGACTENSQCATADYCAGTGCGTAGTCTVRPEICPEIIDPVCGCNGDTYGNSCFAGTAGIRVAYTGMCTTAVDAGTDTGTDVRTDTGTATDTGTDVGTDTGTVTDTGTGGCTENSMCSAADYCAGTGCGTPGTCVPRPEICPLIVMPTCGCNGVTYTNACYCEGAGERVAYDTACTTGGTDAGASCGPTPCAAGQMCCASTRMCYAETCLSCCPLPP